MIGGVFLDYVCPEMKYYKKFHSYDVQILKIGNAMLFCTYNGVLYMILRTRVKRYLYRYYILMNSKVVDEFYIKHKAYDTILYLLEKRRNLHEYKKNY